MHKWYRIPIKKPDLTADIYNDSRITLTSAGSGDIADIVSQGGG